MEPTATAENPYVRKITNDKNIYQRLIEVQKKVATVFKNETVSTGGEKTYKAVSHDDVALLLHGPLADAGIVLLPTITEQLFSQFEVEKGNANNKYVQRWYRTDLKLNVKWINADDPKDFIESNGGAYALDTSDKSPAKAYSLALKIILLKVHLLESRDEEEQRDFEKTTPAAQSAPPKKTAPPAAAPKKDPHPPVGSQDPEVRKAQALDHLVKLDKKKKLGAEYVKAAIKRCVGSVKRADTLTEAELIAVIDWIEAQNP